MYKGIPNSPEATLTSDINSLQTTITVSDANIIPEVPNILVIGGNTDNPETVKVTGKNGNTLTVERGFQGVPRSWNAGTIIARNFTEYDYNALKENIETLDKEIGNLDSLSTEEKSNLVGAINEVCDDLDAHKAEKASQIQLGHVKVDGTTIIADEEGIISAEIPDIDISGKLDKSGDTIENYREKLVELTGVTPDVDLSQANVFKLILEGATELTISNPSEDVSQSFTLIIIQPTTPYTIIFPPSIKWMNGEIPDLSEGNKTYYLLLDTIDSGVTWHGRFGGMF